MEAVEVNGYRIEPGAYLERADLLVANLEMAYLEEATADEGTIWPVGFDPEAAGVIFED